MIPLFKPSITDADIAAVSDVLRSGWLGQGARVTELEDRLAGIHGYRYAVCTNSATAALHLACIVAGVNSYSDVITPALTFVSTAQAPAICGARVVFADVRQDTLTIDWQDVERKSSDSVNRVVIAVDYGGYPAGHGNYDGIVIQDAAHSLGTVGYGDIMTLSFHAVKHIATGDGGAMLTNNKAWADRARRLRWLGIDKSTSERNIGGYSWDYDIKETGYKYQANDITAALALSQLDRLDYLLRRRVELVQVYRNALSWLVEFQPDAVDHAYHLAAVRVDNRDTVMAQLKVDGIATGVHYRPLYHYRPFAANPLPVTEREWQRLISLPLFPDLQDSQAEFIGGRVAEHLERGRG